MLLPTRLPATIPTEFNFNAWNVAANSGREVPIAIINIPTRIGLILYICETIIEFLIARSHDHIKTIRLINTPIKLSINSYPFDLFLVF